MDAVRTVYEIARKEVLQAIRTKRLLVIGLVLVFLLVMVTLVFGPGVTRNATFTGVSKEHVVLVFYFAIGLIGGLQFTQLLAIVITGDAICSEWSNRTIFLLLSKPVSRTSFVLGKFAGAAVTVCGTLAVLFTLDYLLMQPFYSGSPSGVEVAGFFGMLGIVLLGALAFAALSLFISTLTRSTVMSILLVLALWLILFPILGNIGFFGELGRSNPDLGSDRVDAWRYINPAADMQTGARLLIPKGSDLGDAVTFLNVFQTAPKHVEVAILALLAHIVVWVGLALLVVRRRNFE
jgi:ABC-type transport system involved in multi-copper enzyme maturation permease subunit